MPQRTTATKRRTRQLAADAEQVDDDLLRELTGVDADDVVLADELDALETSDADDRHERFLDGIRALRVNSSGSLLSERLLLVLGGIIAPLGLVVVVLGWWGASNTPYDFEQVPYLISGGMLGLGLVFLGSFFYFAHWLTQLVKEHREQSQAILAALERLAERQDQG
jgi:hypothetical protein